MMLQKRLGVFSLARQTLVLSDVFCMAVGKTHAVVRQSNSFMSIQCRLTVALSLG